MTNVDMRTNFVDMRKVSVMTCLCSDEESTKCFES